MQKISNAFVKAQSEFKAAYKNSINPHFRSKYANIESVIDAISDALAKYELGFIQLVSTVDSKWYIQTKLIHSSGEVIESEKTEIIIQDKTNPQKFGSSLTYFRRYSLMAFFGIPDSEDDDGNEASNKPKQQQQQPAPQYVKKEIINHAPKTIVEATLDYNNFVFEKGPFEGKRFSEIDPIILNKTMNEYAEVYSKSGKQDPRQERIFEMYSKFREAKR